MSSKNLSGITAGKHACNIVLDGMTTALRMTHRSSSGGYRSPSLTDTGERLRTSNRIPVRRNGYKITHSPTVNCSRNERTNREKTAVLKRRTCDRSRYGALYDEKIGKKKYCNVTATEKDNQTKITGRGTSVLGTINYRHTDAGLGLPLEWACVCMGENRIRLCQTLPALRDD